MSHYGTDEWADDEAWAIQEERNAASRAAEEEQERIWAHREGEHYDDQTGESYHVAGCPLCEKEG